MAYGTVKVDNITFDNGGSDQNVTVSGLYRATTSGVTLSGTIAAATVSGVTVIGSTTVSGATVTGTTANFTSGNFGNIISSAATMSGALIMANQQQVRFREAVGNGVNHIALQAPAIVSADQTITLPDQTGTVITTGDNGSVSSTMLATNLTISAAAGSVSTPSIAFTGDLNTGIYSPGADQVAISTNGTERLRIDSSGKVGIGTSSPNYQLHVTTDFAVGASGFNQQLSFTNDTIQSLLLGTGYTALKLNPLGGNVGIGTSSPIQKLSVHGIASDTIDETTGVCKFQADGGNGLLFGTRVSAPYQSYIQSAYVADTSVAQYQLLLNPLGGNVAIGTTAPLGTFHVAATGECKLIIGNEQTNTDGLKRSAIIKKADNNLEIRATESTVASETIFTRTASVESARIDSLGRFGIGTSAPVTSLEVSLPSASATIGNIRITPSTAGQARYYLYNGGAVAEWLFGQKTSTDHKFKISTSVAGSETDVFTIDTSGNVGIGTSSPTSQLEVIGSIKGVAGSFGLFASNGSGTGQTSIGLRREGAPTDQKTWEMLTGSGGEFLIRTISDSYASGQDVFSVYRGSGVGVDNVRLYTNGSERLRIDSSGNVGIGTSSPTTLLDVNADTIRVRTARTPASASATGATGEICWDANYIYVCTATNTWKRTAISTW